MTRLMGWIDERFPLTKLWTEHAAGYYAPKNFNFWYYFGSLAMFVLVIQVVTGIFLTMHYKPDAGAAFASVEHIMRDVNWGWLIRYMHSTGASAFFIVVYLHMFRAFLYGSYKSPRELLWVFGMFLYVCLMAEAFMGYLLPWGQMSFWGAQVIVNLFGTINTGLAEWIRGDYVVSDATLTRFFALHVAAIPLVLVGLAVIHIMALHEVGSNNPDGVEIKKRKNAEGIPVDGIPFHPYYTVKDMVGTVLFLFFFAIVIFSVPEMGGYFLEHANFQPADPLKTPEHIAPVWYFTPFYSVLRAIPHPLIGVLAMGAAVVVLFFMPWIDRNPIKSVRYRSSLFRINLLVFAITFIVLGVYGTMPATPVRGEIAARLSEIYFLFFFVLWFYSKPRSAGVTFIWSVFWLAVLALIDFVRFNENVATETYAGWFAPAVYLLAMLVLPLVTSWNSERPVPEGVRA
ncbi:MAG: cytochrome b [Gammaproteobacteria bacterium]